MKKRSKKYFFIKKYFTRFNDRDSNNENYGPVIKCTLAQILSSLDRIKKAS